MTDILEKKYKNASQLTVEKIKRLISRSYDVGDVLPAHRELAAQLSVGHATVTKAMKTLSAQLIVNPVRSKGTVVLRRPSSEVPALSQIAYIPKSGLSALFVGYRGQMLSGLGSKMDEYGMNLVLFPNKHKYRGAGPMEEVITVADALVLEGITDVDVVDDYIAMGLPIVCMDHYSQAAGVDTVVCDNFGAGHRVVKHLAELGHRHLSYVRQSPYVSRDSDNVERLAAFEKAVIELQLTCGPIFSVNSNNASECDAVGDSIVDMLQSSKNPPTAIVVADEATAEWLLGACRKAGIKVPRDLSIAVIAQCEYGGLRNVNYISGCVMGFREMGIKAIATLKRRCQEPKADPFLVRVGFEFVEGYTCRAVNN
ncbi:MAG: substrate-binding domain-containing protein [Kiritimatiellae bacterium]|nr:substrate-binding domain-containing protein [Kiritimatiellia bacterium]